MDNLHMPQRDIIQQDKHTPRIEDGNDSGSEDDKTVWDRHRLTNALMNIEIELIRLKQQKEDIKKGLKRLDNRKANK